MWKHEKRPITFALCVDDFGVKYNNKNDVKHLIEILQQDYVISIDWKGNNYCGLTMTWDYKNGHVDVFMPDYIEKSLTKYNHPAPSRKQFAPHTWTAKNYGKKTKKQLLMTLRRN